MTAPINTSAADWERLLPGSSEMAARMRTLDWSQTELGSPTTWPHSLWTTLRICLTAPAPTLIWWGSELMVLYNDACIPLLGSLHHLPVLGRPARQGWHEVWDTFGPLLEDLRVTALPIAVDDAPFLIQLSQQNHGSIHCSHTPMLAADGQHVEGIVTQCVVTPAYARAAGPSEAMPATSDETLQQRDSAVDAALRESEQRFRALVTTGAYAIYRMSPDWTAMRQLDGRGFIADTDQPSESWLASYIEPDDQPAVLVAIQEAIHTKRMFELEHRVRRADGSLGWTHSRAVPLLDSNGAIIEWFGSASDVTARRHAEEALRESEAKYRTLFETIDEGFCVIEVILDDQGRTTDFIYREVNASFERQTGRHDVIGKQASQVLPNFESFWIDLLTRVYTTGTPERVEAYVADFGRWYNVHHSRVDGIGSRLIAAVFDDISERKHYERQQAFFLRLGDALRPLAIPDAVQEVTTRLTMEYFQSDRCYYCEIAGGNAIIRQDAAQDGLPSVAGMYALGSMPIFKTVVDTGLPFVVHDAYTSDLLDEHLRQLCIQLQIISFLDVPVIKNDQPVGLLCITQQTQRTWTELEVTLAVEAAERTWAAVERAHVEAALQQAYDALEQRVQERTAELATANQSLHQEIGERRQLVAQRAVLIERLISAQENERQRIALELHDTLGQLLSTLNLRLALMQSLEDTLPTIREELTQLQTLTMQVDREVDRLTTELRPPALEQLGLADALYSYIQEWSATSGLSVDVLLIGLETTRLPAAIETTTYRIVQEAMTNVLKHAHASKVSVLVERHMHMLRAIIEDNGAGFEPDQVRSESTGGQQIGLLGMAERAVLAGGDLQIESAPGAGTTIYLHIPLRTHGIQDRAEGTE